MFRAIFLVQLLACVASNLSENNSTQLAIDHEMANIDTQDNHHSNSSDSVSSLPLEYFGQGANIGQVKVAVKPTVVINVNNNYASQMPPPAPVVGPTTASPNRPTHEASRVELFYESDDPLNDHVHAAVGTLVKEALDDGLTRWSRHTCEGLKNQFGATFECFFASKYPELLDTCRRGCAIFKLHKLDNVFYIRVKYSTV
ncbi:hypothetical protein HDE_13840 [Halotydeus destructor]|nr:hypothetical protein HDE_13840 [Halotydeus destructor]